MQEEEEAIGYLDKVLEEEEEERSSTPSSPASEKGGQDVGKGVDMRRLVLKDFLASEEMYINQLEALLLPMKPLKATATTSQPVLTIQQIETIFYKIQDIYEIHKEFYDSLWPQVQNWDSSVVLGHLFQKLSRTINRGSEKRGQYVARVLHSDLFLKGMATVFEASLFRKKVTKI